MENHEDLTSRADRAPSPSLNPANVDELIAALPERVVESLSATDIEALASGNPQAVARILAELPDGNHENPPDSSASPAEAAAAVPPQQADGGPERISLRGLSAQDRIALADLVRAVKDGRFTSLEEARVALQPVTAAASMTHAENHEAQLPPSTPALTQALQRIAHLQSLQQDAANAYDGATLQHLNGAMVEAMQELHHAQAEAALQQTHPQTQALDSWAQEEAHHLATAQQQHAAELGDAAFSQALLEERDLAEARHDPVLQTPVWPAQLMARARERVQRQADIIRPQARARGMVASPSARGAAALSLDEAFEQIEGMSEAEVDAVLTQMRERERASRFSRAA